MKHITIGSVRIPTNEFAIAGTGCLGIRKSGKTYCAKGVIEQLLEQSVPVIVFDAIGVWHHLRTPAASGGRGYEVVVAGGQHADVPISAKNVKEIIRASMRSGVSLVVDLYDPKLSKADWRTIVQEGFRTLMYENKPFGNRYVVLEEAAEYIPQRISDPKTYAEVEKVARMGGNAGLGLMLINQRSQELNKAVLDLCDNLVLMRQRGAHAIDAVSKWMDKVNPDVAKDISISLPSMGSGECWVWAENSDTPIKTRTAKINSFHPDRTNQSEAIAVRKAIDTSDFIAKVLRELPKLEEEKKATDPAELRKRISELERQIKNQKPEQVDRPAMTSDERKRLDALVKSYEDVDRMMTEINSGLDEVKRVVTSCRAEANFFKAVLTERLKPTIALPLPRAAVNDVKRAARSGDWKPSGNGEGLGRCERSILTVLAQYPDGRDSSQVAILSGYSSGSGGFNNALSNLRSQGLITRSNPMQITEEGKFALGNYEPLPTGEALIKYWYNKLGLCERKILEVLVNCYPEGMSVEHIGDATGYSPNSGGFNNALSRLRTLELITRDRPAKAHPNLFQ